MQAEPSRWLLREPGLQVTRLKRQPKAVPTAVDEPAPPMRDREDRVSSRPHANGCLTVGTVKAELGPRPKHMLRCEELGLLNIVILAAAPMEQKPRNDAIDHSETLSSDAHEHSDRSARRHARSRRRAQARARWSSLESS